MEAKLAKGFADRVNARFSKFDMQVGILNDGPHKEPMERGPTAQDFSANLSTYAGGQIRKKGSKDGPLSIAEVSAANRERLGFNYLIEPFKNRSSDIIKFSEAFFRMASGRSTTLRRRCENLLQAIVRNPILRGEYGRQAKSTTREKGFYRPMIDTAQLFKAIKAMVKAKNV